jgi:anti-sigma regulatory factor (Ser/Thr protein kinase)
VERVIQFHGGPRAVGAAREAVIDHTEGLPTETVEDLELLVSEVVTNAVIHGRAHRDRTIELRLREEPGLLRVEVSDEGPGFDRHTLSPRDEGGWGLLFVDKLADRWDVHRLDHQTVLWFEIDISGTGPRGSKHRRASQTPRRRPPRQLSA